MFAALSLLLVTVLFRRDERQENGNWVWGELGPDGAADKLPGFDLNKQFA